MKTAAPVPGEASPIGRRQRHRLLLAAPRAQLGLGPAEQVLAGGGRCPGVGVSLPPWSEGILGN